MKRLTLAGLILGLAAVAHSETREPLRVAILESKTVATAWQEIAPHLAAAGFEVLKTTVPQDASSLLPSGQADLALVHVAEAAAAIAESGAEPIAFASAPLPVVIAVRDDSDIQALEELAGRSFAFTRPNSVSGHLVPKWLLRDNGVDPGSLAGGFLGSGRTVSASLLGRRVDAGVIDFPRFEKERARGLRALVVSPPIPGITLVARPGLEPNLVTTLRAAFRDSRDGSVAAERSDFDLVIRALGLSAVATDD